MLDEKQIEMKKEIENIVKSHFSDKENVLLNMLNPVFVDCDYSSKSVTVKYKAEKWNMNTGGSMHGGIISTAFDNCFGMLAHYFSKKMVTTVDLNVRFLKPVLLGDDLIIKAKADHVGRTLISLSAESFSRGNVKTAAASATFMVIGEAN
jgi:uncharacterized protein (TIGR00369 family)